MAILGIGLDLIEIARIQSLAERKTAFAERVLSDKEQEQYRTIRSDKRRFEYLAGRWAAKEAFGKARQVGVFPHHGFDDVSVLNTEAGVPYIETSLIDQATQRVHISLTHTDAYAAALVIIETK